MKKVDAVRDVMLERVRKLILFSSVSKVLVLCGFALSSSVTQRYASRVLLLSVASLLSSCGSDEPHEPIDTITVEVTGSDYNWHFRYPGEDGVMGTDDDRFSERNLYLPDNANVILDLKSDDYVYNITLPDIGKKEIAVPDLAFNLKFKTQDEAIWIFKGDQFCGFSHETLIGKVFIREQKSDGFYNW